MNEGIQRKRAHLYGRRKGPKLSAHQESLRSNLLPQLALRLEHGAEPARYFGVPVNEVWLEVGFGAGEHLIQQAETHLSVGVLGAEPYVSGVAKLLSRMASQAALAERVRIYEGDARDILDALPNNCLGRVFVLFPDPWPKTRHHKRRFIQTGMLSELARVLRPGGELRFASDDPGYFCWTLERLTAHEDFAWLAESAGDWSVRPADWPQTRYEAKALHGPPRYLRFQRR